MPTPLVVGVFHGKNGVLLDEYAQERFVKEICPLITDETVLVLECGYRRTIFTSTHKKYQARHKEAERALGVTLPTSPILAWRDPRYFPAHRRIIAELFFSSAEKDVISRIARPGLTCNSLSELVQRVESGLAPHLPKKQLTQVEKTLLWGFAAAMKEFDRRTTAVAAQQSKERQVIVVCGALHALAITRKEPWTLRLLVSETPRNAHRLIRAYHAAYVLHEYLRWGQQVK